MSTAQSVILDLLDTLQSDPAVKAVRRNISGIGGLNNKQEALILSSAFLAEKRTFVVVKPNLFQARNLYARLNELIGKDALLFAVEESLQAEAIAASPELEASRIETLSILAQDPAPRIVVTHLAGLMRYLPLKSIFCDTVMEIHKDDVIDPQELKEKLKKAGYRLTDRAELPLTYSYRGEVVDIYSAQYDHPVRLEFFDDEVESIRIFDSMTQRTIRDVEHVTIIPATDMLYTDDQMSYIEAKINEKLTLDSQNLEGDEKTALEENIRQDIEYLKTGTKEGRLYRYMSLLPDDGTILDYVDDPKVILSPAEQIYDHRKSWMEETITYIREMYQEGRTLLRFELYADMDRILGGMDVLEFNEITLDPASPRTSVQPVDFPALALPGALKEAENISRSGVSVISLSDSQSRRVIECLIEQKIPYRMVTDTMPRTNGLYVWINDMYEGFKWLPGNLYVLTEKEIFGVKIKAGRYMDKFRTAQVLEDYDDLAPGDFVVHSEYGIGRYLGIVTKEFKGVHNDYLNIGFRGDDVLLVPLEQFRLVRKFIGAEGAVPKLSKLGTGEWKKTKAKLQENVEQLAEDLLRLYTVREQDIGHAFSEDNDMVRDFENEFDYELTPDQAKAIEEVKKDMESKVPMDRLICGDVGFGKTEVAIRAAFKAAMDGKQTAVLCPTTILARQHYLTFKQRMKNFPIEIRLMNRFVEPSKQKDTLEGVKSGYVDIVVGTHRLLSKDMKYKDLGLLVIDEEQRFGVSDKEKIKVLKESVDVLSLSATPIPRTLQMSLIGVRSLSQLNTPPMDRVPVQTYVIEKSRSVIREVIERELSRDGQVFYLFNNVKFIYEEARKIRQLVPEARVGVAHGQMDRDEIEDVMMRFTDGEYNVLICTTIIENGIDIANANTILVDSADRFGLSQLYQIKGRVGRSNRVAYAYLMYNGKKMLNETATKRLDAIKDFTQLGSGYKIAMRDLAIRGAGDLLGAKQAGFINTVGMDLYVDMLQDAIRRKKGIELRQESEIVPRSRIGVDGYIPKEFARKDYEKIHLYQRIDAANTEAQLNKLEEEVVDRYGKSPDAVKLLFEKRRMEILSNDPRVQELKDLPQTLEIWFSKKWCDQIDGVKFFEKVSALSLDIRMRYKGVIILTIPKKGNWMALAIRVLESVKDL